MNMQQQFSPNGAKVNSQGRKPLVLIRRKYKPQRGDSGHCRPFGAFPSCALFQGLTPLAIYCRRFAAPERAGASCILPSPAFSRSAGKEGKG
jgi:hypothetical protein